MFVQYNPQYSGHFGIYQRKKGKYYVNEGIERNAVLQVSVVLFAINSIKNINNIY